MNLVEGKLIDRTFVFAFLSGLFMSFSAACNTVYPIFIRFEGGSAYTIGLFMGLLNLSALAGRPLIGMMIDRWGAKSVMLLATVVMSLPALGFLLLIDNGIGPAIWVLRIIQGLGGGAHFTAYMLFAAETAPPTRRSEMVGRYGIAGLAGAMVVPPIAEKIVMPSGPGSTSTSTLTLLFTIVLALGALACLSTILIPSSPRNTAGKLPSTRGLIDTIKSNRMRLVFAIAFLFSIGFAAAPSFLAPVAFTRGIQGFGLYFTGFGLSAIFVRAFSAKWGDRYGMRRVLVPCFLLYAFGLMILHFSTSTEWVVISGIINGIAHGIAFPLVTTLGYTMAPKGYTGSSMALVTGMMDGGTALSAFALGQAAEWWGYGVIFPASAFAIILAILILLRDVLIRPKPIKKQKTMEFKY